MCSTALQVKTVMAAEGTHRPVTLTPTQDCPTPVGARGLWGQRGEGEAQIHHPRSPTLSRTYTHMGQQD